jgi:hypothetical protein
VFIIGSIIVQKVDDMGIDSIKNTLRHLNLVKNLADVALCHSHLRYRQTDKKEKSVEFFHNQDKG